MTIPAPALDATDRRLIKATQEGLPLTRQPYHAVGAAIGSAGEEVMERVRRLMAEGIIRRIGVVANHYRLGYVANGMTVWDIADDAVAGAGAEVGALDFVSHCYQRPRHLPLWPYNLFAMVHGRSRDEVGLKVAEIARILGPRVCQYDVLYSSRILKKTGLRLFDQGAL
ncbi:MAG: AsnC family transcriptional regulator [Defluviicoccus sp.]